MHRKRFLVLTWDGAGNLPPELALAGELVRRGHEVDVCGQESIRDRVEGAGCRFLALRSVRQWDITDPNWPDDEETFFIEHCWFSKSYGNDLAALLEASSYDMLLIDCGLIFGLSTALSSGIPTAALVHFPVGLIESGPLADVWDAEVSRVSAELPHVGGAPVERYADLVKAADSVLVFSYLGFDDTTADVVHVGPLRSPGIGETWMRRYSERPLVVVGLSTSNQKQAPLLQRICNALGGLHVEALVTTGPSVAPSALVASDNVSIVEYLVHDDVLPATDLLITHAGHGTVMAGVTYGVPLLCLPMGRDQPAIAARVADLGLGCVLDQDASEGEIARSVQSMLADQAARLNCREFAAQLEGHPGLDDAVEVVEGLAG